MRSAASTARALPSARARIAPGAASALSGVTTWKRAVGSRADRARRAQDRPATRPSCRAAHTTDRRASASIQASPVMSPARPRSSARAMSMIGRTRRSGRGVIKTAPTAEYGIWDENSGRDVGVAFEDGDGSPGPVGLGFAMDGDLAGLGLDDPVFGVRRPGRRGDSSRQGRFHGSRSRPPPPIRPARPERIFLVGWPV